MYAAGALGVSIGNNTSATGGSSIAIGDRADSQADNSVALGIITRIGASANQATALNSGGYTVMNPGSILLGSKAVGLVNYTTTIIERVMANTTNATETSVGAFTLGNGCSYTVKGTVQAVSMSSTSSVVWEVSGSISCNGSTRISDLLFRRVGGSASSNTGAMKLRYTLAAGSGTYHTFTLLGKGLSSETVLWSGDINFQGTPDDFVTSPSSYGMPIAWTVGPSVRATATASLTAGQFVQVYNAAGTASVRPADADAPYEATGFVLEDYSSSDTAIVYLSGENPYCSGLTVGPVYLSTTAGAVTSTVYTSTGSLVQQVGTALSSTKMLVQIGVPVML